MCMSLLVARLTGVLVCPGPWELTEAAVHSLLGVAGTKSQALQFAAGEALCFAFGGAPAHLIAVS